MRIILDTNILRQDFFIRSRKFELLVDFISKTTHSIVLPQVIYDEIISLYKRELLESHRNYLKGKNDLFSKLLSVHKRKDIKLDVDKEIKLFTKNLRKRLQFHKDSIVPHNVDHLPDLVDRAINRRPPFIKSEKEFRDGLIWLSLFDISNKFKTKSIVFISNNTKDFCDKEKKLHADLVEESRLKGIELSYYSSLDDFIRDYASKIEFITEKWILDNISIDKLNEEIDDYISLMEEDSVKEYVNNEDENSDEVSTISVLSTSLTDFYVYEMADGSYRVEASFESELEVEYETENEYDFCYPTAESEVHIIINKKKVEELEVTGAYIY